MTRLILIIILLLFPRGSALAVDWKRVSHEEAKIVASLDWTWVRPEYGGYSAAWTDNYDKFMQFAWWTEGLYPRLELGPVDNYLSQTIMQAMQIMDMKAWAVLS